MSQIKGINKRFALGVVGDYYPTPPVEPSEITISTVIENYYRFASSGTSFIETPIETFSNSWTFKFFIRRYASLPSSDVPILSAYVDVNNYIFLAYIPSTGKFSFQQKVAGTSYSFTSSDSLVITDSTDWSIIELTINHVGGLASLTENEALIFNDNSLMIGSSPLVGAKINIGKYLNTYCWDVDITNIRLTLNANGFYIRGYERIPWFASPFPSYIKDYLYSNDCTPTTITNLSEFFRLPAKWDYLNQAQRTTFSLEGKVLSYKVKDRNSSTYVRKLGNRYTYTHKIYDFTAEDKAYFLSLNATIKSYLPHYDTDYDIPCYIDSYFNKIDDYPSSFIEIILTNVYIDTNPDISDSGLTDSYSWYILDTDSHGEVLPKMKLGALEYKFEPDPIKPTEVKMSEKNIVEWEEDSITGKLQRSYVRDEAGNVVKDIKYTVKKWNLTRADYETLRAYDRKTVEFYPERSDESVCFDADCSMLFLNYKNFTHCDHVEIEYTVRKQI